MAAITDFDVIIVGGSYAGLSAAMAKEQVLRYNTVTFHTGLATGGQKTEHDFEITTQAGEAFTAKKLIFATGIHDIKPDINGFAACWGISVIHCPYCHGYEFRQQTTGILANGERGIHLASLVCNLTDRLTIFTSGKADFDAAQLAKLSQHGIEVIETPIAEIEHENGQISHLVLQDGNTFALSALYAALPFTQHSAIPATLGCELTEQGYIQVDAFQRTTISGTYTCGDNASMLRAVANAVYTGNISGAMVNKELVDEQF